MQLNLPALVITGLVVPLEQTPPPYIPGTTEWGTKKESLPN